MPKQSLTLNFGPTAERIEEQLRAKGLFLDLSPFDRQSLQRDANDVNRLHTRGILEEEEAAKAYKRITIEITAHVRKTLDFNG
jgi:hypothetical protein